MFTGNGSEAAGFKKPENETGSNNENGPDNEAVIVKQSGSANRQLDFGKGIRDVQSPESGPAKDDSSSPDFQKVHRASKKDSQPKQIKGFQFLKNKIGGNGMTVGAGQTLQEAPD